MSPKVDFDEPSTFRHAADSKQNLENIGEAFGIEEETHSDGTPTSEVKVGVRNMNGDTSRWELDDEISQCKAAEDEIVPNDPDSLVPIVLREPDPPSPLPHNTEEKSSVSQMPPARPPPREMKVVGRGSITIESSANGRVSNHRASVGVTEIEGNLKQNARKYSYCKALLAAENTNLHHEPTDVKGHKGDLIGQCRKN